MQSRVNPQQLVLRFDSATGFAKVGWAADLPVGRFIHIDVIGEAPGCDVFSADAVADNNPLYHDFQRACQRARNINAPLLNEQTDGFLAKGFSPVPLDLNAPNAATDPDLFGSYHEVAMRALFRLTANFALAWAVIKEQTVVQLHSCKPPKPMEELEYQVWKHHILNQLSQTPGKVVTGNLIVQESGLWFCPQTHRQDLPRYSSL